MKKYPVFKSVLNRRSIRNYTDEQIGDKEIIISPAIVFAGRYINYYGAKVHFLGFSYTPIMYQRIQEKKKHSKHGKLQVEVCL